MFSLLLKKIVGLEGIPEEADIGLFRFSPAFVMRRHGANGSVSTVEEWRIMPTRWVVCQEYPVSQVREA